MNFEIKQLVESIWTKGLKRFHDCFGVRGMFRKFCEWPITFCGMLRTYVMHVLNALNFAFTMITKSTFAY